MNEKANPISPKITDQGATVVDRTVNNTFVSTVSDVLVKAVNSANGTISGNTNAIANETIGELDNTKRNVGTIRSAIADFDTQLANVPQQTKAARNALNDVQLAAASAGRGLAGASTAIGTAQTQLNTLSSNANSALETGSGLVSQATAQSTASINQISSAVSAASQSIGYRLAADLVPVVFPEPLAHACRGFGEMYGFGLGSALLSQLGHVDGATAFAEPQRLAFRGEDFASAFGAHADDPTRAWHAVDDPLDSLACPGEAPHVPSGVRRPAQEGQDDWRSFCEPLPLAEPCSRVRACLFDGLLGLVEL